MFQGIMRDERCGVFPFFDPGISVPTNSLFAVFGDSNSNGKADPSKADPAFNITTALTSLQFNGRSAAGAGVDPPTWTDFDTDMVMRTLAPRATTFGFEMGLGSVLQAAGIPASISQVGIDGSSLSGNWLPTSTFMLASTGRNLFNTWVARQQSFELSLNKRLSGVVVSLGTNDAAAAGFANGFQANMAATTAAIRAIWPGLPIAWIKTNPTTTGSNVATVIAAQVAQAALEPNTILVDNSDLVLTTDNLHYTSNSIWTAGARAGIGILDTMGQSRRTFQVPTVVGWGPAEFGSGSLFPNSAADVRPGDLEVMAVTMGIAAGTFAIGTPSGWTPLTASDSTSSGVTQHLALFTRRVSSAALTGALGHASSSLVSGSDNRMTAKVFNVRGNANPTVNSSTGTIPNSFGTGPTPFLGVTASLGNATALVFACAWCGSSPTTTVTNATLTNFGKVQDGAYVNAFTDRSVICLATGTLSSAGPTGTSTVTTSANCVEVGATVAIV